MHEFIVFRIRLQDLSIRGYVQRSPDSANEPSDGTDSPGGDDISLHTNRKGSQDTGKLSGDLMRINVMAVLCIRAVNMVWIRLRLRWLDSRGHFLTVLISVRRRAIY